jgi:hypothetical protein
MINQIQFIIFSVIYSVFLVWFTAAQSIFQSGWLRAEMFNQNANQGNPSCVAGRRNATRPRAAGISRFIASRGPCIRRLTRARLFNTHN